MSEHQSARTAAPDSEFRSRTVPVSGVPVYYVERGSGVPVLALHGSYVDHHLMTGCLEPLFAGRPGYRRIYPDLPGMGRTPAPGTINSTDDLLDTMLGLIDAVIGDEAFLLVGLSLGGYLARAIANRRPGQVAGLCLICPLGAEALGAGRNVPAHAILHASGDLGGILDPALEKQYRDYLVVQTPQTLRSFQEWEGPGIALADLPALERVQANWVLRESPEQGAAYPHPALILTGRQDSFVGYAAAWGWLAHYPRATFAVLDRAGHGIEHEQPALFTALLAEWLDRAAEHRASTGIAPR